MDSIQRPTFRPFVAEQQPPSVAKEWTFDFNSILTSPRKVKGKFHTPQIDRDNEFIDKAAIKNAVPDFMHLPILHDFHKERTVGIVTRVVELSDGSFDFEGLIKATDDCNDIWELIKAGKYDQVSIYGKRLAGTSSCSLRPEQRMEPCTTTGVRLDSISVCDSNARNDGTSLMVAKGAKVVFEATEEIIKAETTSSNLMHTVTDYPKRKFGSDGLPRTEKRSTATIPQYERPDVEKGDDMDVTEEKAEQRIPLKEQPKPKPKPGIREAGEGDKKSSMMKGDSVAAIINSIADDLEGLVMADQKELGTPHATDQVEPSGEPEWEDQPQPEADREYGTPEDATYDEEKAKAGKFKQSLGDAGDRLDTRALEARGETKIPDHAKHLAAQYLMEKHYEQAERDQANKVQHEARVQTQKEEYIHPKPKEPLRADSAVAEDPGFGHTTYEASEEEKAKDAPQQVRPPWARGEAGYAAHQDLQPQPYNKEVAQRAAGEGKVKHKIKEEAGASRPRGTPPRPEHETTKRTDMDEPYWKKPEQGAKQPPWAGQKHSSEGEAGFSRRTAGGEESYLPHAKEAAEAAKRPEPVRPEKLTSERPVRTEGESSGTIAINRRVPDGAEPTHKLEVPHKELKLPKREFNEPTYHTEYKEFHPQTEEGKRFKREAEADQFGTKRGKPTAEGGRREETKEYEEKAEVDGGGDLQGSIERLAKLVSMLVQSDKRVHAEMGGTAPEPNEEEKCGKICKGTETMEDKDVDLLVKAKVDAKVDEIAKAYQVQVDELKKANADLAARIEKMEKETIEKSGVVAILREGDEGMGTVFNSNAAAISAITKAKGKV